MNTLLKAFRLTLTLSTALVVLGCQGNQRAAQGLQAAHQDFGSSWSAYKSCKGSQELSTALQESDLLQAASELSQTQAEGGLGAQVSALFTANRPRYAADPLQMSMDCLLHAGKLAESKEDFDLAYSLYKQVLRTPHTQNTDYFLNVAHAGLARLVGATHSTTALLLSAK